MPRPRKRGRFKMCGRVRLYATAHTRARAWTAIAGEYLAEDALGALRLRVRVFDMRMLVDVRRRLGVGTFRFLRQFVRPGRDGERNLFASVHAGFLIYTMRQTKRPLLLSSNTLNSVERVVATATASLPTGMAHAN